ncbi:MAG: beta-ketoacyl-ACP synthase 3 [Bacteroidales bacterium]|nr:beta-ketoacyl-ACP synthase 3 [Bacteroidales bacterium]
MKIIGTGSALPEKVVTNEMLASFLETSDEWISTRTGIKTRRLLSHETLIDLGVEAGKKAMAASGLQGSDIDYLICSNVANTYVTPSISSIILSQIGCKCPCLDVNCACTGFIYALDIAEAFHKAKKYKNILIICTESPSRYCNWHERETSVLFGDGAGAVVVTDGDNFVDSIVTGDSHTDVLYYKRTMEFTPFDRAEERTTSLVMQGREVFKLAVRSCTRDIRTILERNNMKPEDFQYFLLHQANLRIIDSIRENMKQPVEKFPTNLQKYGNTSSASIPIMIDEMSRANMFEDGANLLLSAFGGGFVTGAAIMKWEKINYND